MIHTNTHTLDIGRLFARKLPLYYGHFMQTEKNLFISLSLSKPQEETFLINIKIYPITLGRAGSRKYDEKYENYHKRRQFKSNLLLET
jgi:hypothetical protein